MTDKDSVRKLRSDFEWLCKAETVCTSVSYTHLWYICKDVYRRSVPVERKTNCTYKSMFLSLPPAT